MGGPKYINKKTGEVPEEPKPIIKRTPLEDGARKIVTAAIIGTLSVEGVNSTTAKEIAQKVDPGKLIAQGIGTANTFKKLEIPQKEVNTSKIRSEGWRARTRHTLFQPISYEEVNASKVQTEEWMKQKKIVIQSFKEYPYELSKCDSDDLLVFTAKGFYKVLKEWALGYLEYDCFPKFDAPPFINGIPSGHKKPNKYILDVFRKDTTRNGDTPRSEFLPLTIEYAELKSLIKDRYIDPFHFVEFYAVQRTDEPGQSILIGVDPGHISFFIYNNEKKEIYSESHHIGALAPMDKAGLFFCPSKNEQGIEGFRVIVIDKDNVRDIAGEYVAILECYPSLQKIVPCGLYQVEPPKKY